MFSEKLENLIKATLQDGVLTEQEKNAIIKRAQAEGEDIDEVDIYIQSLQQERQAELQEKAQKTANEEMKARKKAQEAKIKADQEEEKERATILRKCPACGCSIPHLSNVCPECGHVISTSNNDQEVMELIQVFIKSKDNFLKRVSKSAYDNDPIMKKAYHIRSKEKESYVLETNRDTIKTTLETLYGDNPKVKKILHDYNVKSFNDILVSIRNKIRKAKEESNKNEKYFNMWYNEVLERFEELKKYRDIEECTETYNKVKDEIENLRFKKPNIFKKLSYKIEHLWWKLT